MAGEVMSGGTALYQFASNPTAGNAARVGVQAVIIATSFIPVVGWAISFGLGIADYFGAFDGLYKN